MKEEQKTTETEPSCNCVILNIPSEATTSMWDCPAHGERDTLTPLPGQGLRYAVMYGASGVYSLIGPLATTEAIETTKFLLGRLGSSVEGVFALTSYADLERWAADKGALSPPEMAPAPVKRLPKGTVPVQAHEPGCAYAEQGHPGGCYIPPSAPQVINTNTPPWS